LGHSVFVIITENTRGMLHPIETHADISLLRQTSEQLIAGIKAYANPAVQQSSSTTEILNSTTNEEV
jgi:hypothetical protein